MGPDAPQLSADKLRIDTPELVSIELLLAGVGSRFIAVLLDTLIWSVVMALLGVLSWMFLPAIGALGVLSYQWTVAVFTFAFFLLHWGYFTLFEAFGGGRTPGKRIAHIRVIQRSGRPIGLFESMARNLIRFVDELPLFYVVGLISVFVTRQHQRLGDLAAGTLVVRDRLQQVPLWNEWAPPAAFVSTSSALPTPSDAALFPDSCIIKLGIADLAVLEGFFARRLDLPLETRRNLGRRLAFSVQTRSGLEVPAGMSEETFLEAVACRLRDLVRFR